MAYYVDVTLLGAWCELRSDFRNFRVDRILGAEFLDDRFLAESGKLLAGWLALPKDRPDASTAGPQRAETSAAVVPLRRTGASARKKFKNSLRNDALAGLTRGALSLLRNSIRRRRQINRRTLRSLYVR